MQKKIIIFFWCCFLCVLCGCSVQGSGIKVGGHKYKIEEIYFNNAKGLICHEDNPYRESILADIELVSQKETRKPTEFDFEPELTLITSTGDICEMSFSVTAYEYPDEEGVEYENRDESAYYIKILRGEKSETLYYEIDEDVTRLRKNISSAVSYEYSRLGTFTGVIRCIGSGVIEVVSSEYGNLIVKTEDFDGAIVGDTVEVELVEKPDGKKMTAGCAGVVHNLTRNDVAATSEIYLTALPFQYDILSYLGEPDVFLINQLDVAASKEEFDFLLELGGADLPEEVTEHLRSAYDDDFFAENILLYCGLDSMDAEVTAVVQTKWGEDRNIVYVRKGEGSENPVGEVSFLCIEVPLADWNGKIFELYLFE
ncbi:MAG: hypothetical protein NC124_11635 [Clostridium sp.]|nr:hypothetical protein [Clostridium sp.]